MGTNLNREEVVKWQRESGLMDINKLREIDERISELIAQAPVGTQIFGLLYSMQVTVSGLIRNLERSWDESDSNSTTR